MLAKLNAQCNRMGFFLVSLVFSKTLATQQKKIGHLPLLVLYSFVERDPSHVNELAAEQMLLYRKLETNQNHCRFVLMIFVQ